MVEDVQSDNNETYRRLVFLSNQNVVQSEAKLKRGTLPTFWVSSMMII